MLVGLPLRSHPVINVLVISNAKIIIVYGFSLLFFKSPCVFMLKNANFSTKFICILFYRLGLSD